MLLVRAAAKPQMMRHYDGMARCPVRERSARTERGRGHRGSMVGVRRDIPFAPSGRSAMPMAETRRRAATGMRFAWLLGGRLAIAGCALAFGGALALQVEVAAAKSAHSGAKATKKTTTEDDDDNDASASAASSSAGSSVGGATNPGAPGTSASPAAPAASGSHVNLLGGNSDTAPRVGLGFNNDSASVNATIPFGGAHHLAEPPNERVTHPMLTIPFERNGGGLSHLLSPPAPAHALSYGETGTPLLGGTPALTNRLIRSVTTTYSD